MADAPTVLIPASVLSFIQKNRNMLMPITALSLIFVVLVPLPTAVMDMLLLINITVYLPKRLGGMHGLYGVDRAPLQPVQNADLGKSLIIVTQQKAGTSTAG